MKRQQWFNGPLAIMLVLTAGCDDKTTRPPAPRYVLSATALTESASGLSLAGTVQPRFTSPLSFQTGGRIISRHVEIGDAVVTGQVLAQLDPLALAFSVQSAQASVQESLATLRTARLTAKRQRTLAVEQLASMEERDVAEQALAAAKEAVREAQSRLLKATEQMKDADLKAPFNGVITSVSLESGQTVSAGQTVLQLADLDLRDAVFDVPEDQLTKLRLGQQFVVTLQMDPSVKWTGELREISPATDTVTRLRRVKIALHDAPASLRIGAVVTLVSSVFPPETGHTIFIPSTAILERQNASFVWVIDPSSMTVELRKIQVAASPQKERVQVVSGLIEGENVVTAGVNSLQPGQKIRMQRTSVL
ncbi:efflux RND transporter periplasmic adaptor subunit [Kosakonia sp. ML.JS2a]|uniref:efflux RND transporter periplasmic adaptor subunit n=1 Tax=Kosakonia sp. ML.JS2a TaxID=2980557 RepID=UPI0021DA87D7|nr:efflux RND transporter periplasmic adaptor subunit [Kosakonia sp. ML.JS2a]UXY08932.1 efflux RND transporter periplasmic adaptor subunit [Kosakonia sp. ML.JS2a]